MPIRPARVAQLLALRAWWSLFRTSRSLAKKGFYHTYVPFTRLPSAGTDSAKADGSLLRGVAAFSTAENFFHLKNAPRDCLPRSLALFGFLRSMGLAVEHVIGVQLVPFLAHAWVEYRGRVVGYDRMLWIAG